MDVRPSRLGDTLLQRIATPQSELARDLDQLAEVANTLWHGLRLAAVRVRELHDRAGPGENDD